MMWAGMTWVARNDVGRIMRAAIAIAIACGVAYADRPPVGSTATIDHAVAIVDRAPVWASEVEELADLRAHAAGMLAPTTELVATVTDELISNVLVAHEADKHHIVVDDSEVDSALESIKQANHLDDPAFEKVLTDAHYTRVLYRLEIKRQLRTQKVLMLQVTGRIDVSDDEVTHQYDAMKAEHPLPKLDAQMRDTIKAQLRDKKIGAIHDAWLIDLHRHAHIERRP